MAEAPGALVTWQVPRLCLDSEDLEPLGLGPRNQHLTISLCDSELIQFESPDPVCRGVK